MIRFNCTPGLLMNPPIVGGRIRNLREKDMHIQATVDITYDREDKECVKRFAVALEHLMDNALSPKGGRLVKKSIPVLQFPGPQMITPVVGPQRGDVITVQSTGEEFVIKKVDPTTLTFGKISRWDRILENRAFWFVGGGVLGAGLLLLVLILLAVFGG